MYSCLLKITYDSQSIQYILVLQLSSMIYHFVMIIIIPRWAVLIELGILDISSDYRICIPKSFLPVITSEQWTVKVMFSSVFLFKKDFFCLRNVNDRQWYNNKQVYIYSLLFSFPSSDAVGSKRKIKYIL